MSSDDLDEDAQPVFHVNQRVTCEVWELVPTLCLYGKVVSAKHPFYEVDFDGKCINVHMSALREY